MSTPEESAIEYRKQRSQGAPVRAPDIAQAGRIRADIYREVAEDRRNFQLGGMQRFDAPLQNGTEAVYQTLPRNGRVLNSNQEYTVYADNTLTYTGANGNPLTIWTYTVPTGFVLYLTKLNVTPLSMYDIAGAAPVYMIPGINFYIDIVINGSTDPFSRDILSQPLGDDMRLQIIAGPGQSVEVKFKTYNGLMTPAAYEVNGIVSACGDLLAANDNSVPYTALRP